MSDNKSNSMTPSFVLDGTEYTLIQPNNIEELMQAFESRAVLETLKSKQTAARDMAVYQGLLKKQGDYIQTFVNSLGEFDSGFLASNIAYLAKKYSMRIGELEEILDVSAGYLSRTLKENSKKKLSIDIVWKIARVFGTDINTLTERQMWTDRTNTDLLERFLDKLCDDIRKNVFTWEYEGGAMACLEDRYVTMGLVTEEEDGKAVYHPYDHLNQQMKWLLSADIITLKQFDVDRDLAIIPYKDADKGGKYTGYDFIFVWEDEHDFEPRWEKVFYTSDDPYGTLLAGAKKLYELIESMEFDAKLSSDVYQMISQYVRGGRPE